MYGLMLISLCKGIFRTPVSLVLLNAMVLSISEVTCDTALMTVNALVIGQTQNGG